MSHILNLEKHHLSDGGLAIVNQLGHSYSFTRTYDSFELPPDVILGITKKEAYEKLEAVLKSDVLEGGD